MFENKPSGVMVPTGEYRLAEHPNGRLYLQRAMAPITGGRTEWEEMKTMTQADLQRENMTK